MEHFVDILVKLNLLSVSHAAGIEDTPIKPTQLASNNSSGVGSMLLFIFVFICITSILIFLFIIISKKNEQQIKANKSVRVLDKINLDHNSSLFVVEIQNKIHILGKTDSNVTPITEITDEDNIRIMRTDCLNKREVTFQGVLTEQFNSVSNATSNINKFKNNSAATKAFKSFNKKES